MAFDDIAVHDSDSDTENNETSGSVSTDSEETDSGTTDSKEADSGITDSEESDSMPTDGKEADSMPTDNKETDSVPTDAKGEDASGMYESIVLSDASGTSEYTDATITCIAFGVFFLVGLFLARMTWGYLK